MSAEAYSFREGQLYLWTGSATASAVVAYARDVQLSLAWGIDNVAALDGSYHDRQTGQRADLTIGTLYTYNITLHRIAQSATAFHAKLLQTGINGSAGYVLWSGRFDALTLMGSEGGLMQSTFQSHANRWSAFGG